eukprot:3067176-Rhodomonas_salina.2
MSETAFRLKEPSLVLSNKAQSAQEDSRWVLNGKVPDRVWLLVAVIVVTAVVLGSSQAWPESRVHLSHVLQCQDLGQLISDSPSHLSDD